jgi:hypothetical protein
MNYLNVNLNSAYELDQNILDPYTFDILLLEIACNLKVITKETITAQFNEVLNSKVESAKEIFAANLANIVKKAKQDRAMK